ncbi:MAG: sugar transferase [Chloroflexi bacterium]|nr:sugar transferase [Chloroflexota bacterium]
MPVIKRLFDFTAAALALAVLAPILGLTALLVRTKLGAPILFRQQRPGYRGRPFHILKFRTMSDHRSPDGSLLPDAERLGRFGRFLRSTSLDELPELFNILRGEMSLVGPRPLLMEYLPLYSAEQARRHDMPPGLTGWAQVHGRNALSWPDKFKLDVWYVDHWNFWLDIRILFLTLVKVFQREGIAQEGQVTMEKFRGGDG